MFRVIVRRSMEQAAIIPNQQVANLPVMTIVKPGSRFFEELPYLGEIHGRIIATSKFSEA